MSSCQVLYSSFTVFPDGLKNATIFKGRMAVQQLAQVLLAFEVYRSVAEGSQSGRWALETCRRAHQSQKESESSS